MSLLAHNSYGKSHVRLTKVTRHPGRHDVKELTVALQLEGDFASSYLRGDNSRIVATDSMKNAIYVLAKTHPLDAIESFGQASAEHFLATYPHVSQAQVELAEEQLARLVVAGRDRPCAFIGGGRERRTCTVTQTRQELCVTSGIDDLFLLKTTDSEFTGFIRDGYTTLPETSDRILATEVSATWLCETSSVDWNQCHQLVRRTLLDVFAGHQSRSVQETLYAMATAVLQSCSSIKQISLTLTNRHRIPINLQPFGIEDNNEIFVAASEPYGVITGTVRRESPRP